MIKRTAEKVLSIISLIFTVIAVLFSFIFVVFGKVLTEDAVRQELEAEIYADDPSLDPTEVQMILEILGSISGFGWFSVIVLLISLIATIVGMVSIWNNKNAKLAGIMFIIAGLFAFVLSPTSIMLYVAGILCFVKKPPHTPSAPLEGEGSYDDSMRPL